MGAWDQYYQQEKPLRYGNDDPYGYACISIKKELVYNNFGHGINIKNQVIGASASKQIKNFQLSHNLEADGVIGPKTALILYRRRAMRLENQYGIPFNYLCKLKTLESNNDPGAVGASDPDDHGLVQINSRFHPSISLEQTEDGLFALSFAATSLKSAHDQLHDWDAALASWNVGLVWAGRWLKAGKPTNSEEFFKTAHQYVSILKKMEC